MIKFQESPFWLTFTKKELYIKIRRNSLNKKDHKYPLSITIDSREVVYTHNKNEEEAIEFANNWYNMMESIFKNEI